MFAPSSAIGKNMIFWRKIVIIHPKYPNIFRASLRSSQFFLSAPPNLKSWISPWFPPLIRHQPCYSYSQYVLSIIICMFDGKLFLDFRRHQYQSIHHGMLLSLHLSITYNNWSCGTAIKIKKTSTLSQLLKIQSKNRRKRDSIDTPYTHIYMSAHFLGLVQALQ